MWSCRWVGCDTGKYCLAKLPLARAAFAVAGKYACELIVECQVEHWRILPFCYEFTTLFDGSLGLACVLSWVYG